MELVGDEFDFRCLCCNLLLAALRLTVGYLLFAHMSSIFVSYLVDIFLEIGLDVSKKKV